MSILAIIRTIRRSVLFDEGNRATFALQEALYGIEDGDQEAFESGIAAYREAT